MQRRALSCPALGPVGLDLGDLVGILQCMVKIFEGRIGAGAVRVQDMIGWLELNGLRKLVSISILAGGINKTKLGTN